MAYYENPINKNHEFIFGRGGGAIASMKLNTMVLAQIPIGQPSGKRHSLFEENDSIGQIYLSLAKKIVSLY